MYVYISFIIYLLLLRCFLFSFAYHLQHYHKTCKKT